MARTLPLAQVLNPDVPGGVMIVNLSGPDRRHGARRRSGRAARRKAMKKQEARQCGPAGGDRGSNGCPAAAAEAEANARIAADEAALAAIKAATCRRYVEPDHVTAGTIIVEDGTIVPGANSYARWPPPHVLRQHGLYVVGRADRVAAGAVPAAGVPVHDGRLPQPLAGLRVQPPNDSESGARVSRARGCRAESGLAAHRRDPERHRVVLRRPAPRRTPSRPMPCRRKW